MLETITFLKPWRCFQKETIKFHAGVNLLVGDQGTGKSSLFQAIQVEGMKKTYSWNLPLKDSIPAVIDYQGKATPVFAFDFESDNYRTKTWFGSEIGFHVASMHKSHGEMVTAIIDSWLRIDKPFIVLVDEPDMALSIRSCHKLVRAFQHVTDVGGQVIATAHNPIVIAGFDEVYSLEHRHWMPSGEFIESQGVNQEDQLHAKPAGSKSKGRSRRSA
jgi:predicted ATPase